MNYTSLTKCMNPDGWFQVGYSDDLALGQVKPLKYFNRDLVIWRGDSGKVFIQDAHCAHLGAHRGHTGHVKNTVRGDNLLCPWHMWEWNPEGKLVSIPYSPGECKPTVSIRSYEVTEWCGQIMMWYHQDGTGPSWQLPEVEEYNNPEYYDFKYSRLLHRIKCHPQMPIENMVDFAHIYPIHNSPDFPVCRETTEEGHHFRSIVEVPYGTVGEPGYLTPDGQVTVDVDMNGFGIGATITRWSENLWPSIMITGFTPVDEEYIDYYFVFSAKRAPGETGDEPQGKARAMLRAQSAVIPQDFFVWENMTYMQNAAFSKAESQIYPALRAWAQQFYPDTRPSYERRMQERAGTELVA